MDYEMITLKSVLWSPLIPYMASKYDFVWGKCSKNKGKVFKNRNKTIFKLVCSRSPEPVTMKRHFLCLFYLLSRLRFKFCPDAVLFVFLRGTEPSPAAHFLLPFPWQLRTTALAERSPFFVLQCVFVRVTCGSACRQHGGRRARSVLWKNRCG